MPSKLTRRKLFGLIPIPFLAVAPKKFVIFKPRALGLTTSRVTDMLCRQDTVFHFSVDGVYMQGPVGHWTKLSEPLTFSGGSSFPGIFIYPDPDKANGQA